MPNGASEDMIWQNAHPDHNALKGNKESKTTVQDKVWDWGITAATLEANGEVWEDEIGSLSANLGNNCENKERYLSIGEGGGK